MSAFSSLKPVGGYLHVCICIREILYSEIICLSETANSYNRYESAVRNVLATSGLFVKGNFLWKFVELLNFITCQRTSKLSKSTCPTKIYLPKNGHFSYLPKKTYVGGTQISSILPATYPYFRFCTITWVNINGYSSNLICALKL